MNDKNWPDPKRPGVPYRYEDPRLILDHILMRRSDKALVRARFHWDAGSGGNWQLRNSHWMSAADAALRFTYVCPVLTPTQINEMLAAERERCASVVISHAISPSPIDDPHPDAEWLNGCLSSCVVTIRKLGTAS
ncbi:hypothetical protein S101447_00921 [Acetobacter ascendens]|uniref:Uncharacterized protein n=1 Tax=Acetobacter ascendens TaxID=481146 RepID=A0A1Y0V0X2_9PROT|nr:hypothetical protein S101447_00921 [Acetobacter ascendens]